MFEKIKQIIEELFNIKDITTNTDIREDLGVDSIRLLQLVMAIEDEFEIQVEEQDLEKIHTVADIMEYIKENE